MANKPGSIFPSYGSHGTENIEILVSDKVYFENDYNNLKDKPKVKWGAEGTAVELKDTVDLKTVIPESVFDLDQVYDGTARFASVFVKGNSTDTPAIWTGTTPGIKDLHSGTMIIFCPYVGNAGITTLNINGKGAVPIYSNSPFRCGAGQPLQMVYFDTLNDNNGGWMLIGGYTFSSGGIPKCETLSTDPNKKITSDFEIEENQWFQIDMLNINTYAGALTLSVNGEDAKPIYINGQPTSAENHTIGKGPYFVYYDGEHYNFRSDRGMASSVAEVAKKVEHKLYFGYEGEPDAYEFDGSSELRIPIYTGDY